MWLPADLGKGSTFDSELTQGSAERSSVRSPESPIVSSQDTVNLTSRNYKVLLFVSCAEIKVYVSPWRLICHQTDQISYPGSACRIPAFLYVQWRGNHGDGCVVRQLIWGALSPSFFPSCLLVDVGMLVGMAKRWSARQRFGRRKRWYRGSNSKSLALVFQILLHGKSRTILRREINIQPGSHLPGAGAWAQHPVHTGQEFFHWAIPALFDISFPCWSYTFPSLDYKFPKNGGPNVNVLFVGSSVKDFSFSFFYDVLISVVSLICVSTRRLQMSVAL